MDKLEELQALIEKTVRLTARNVITPAEGAHHLFDNLEYVMIKHGDHGHVDYFLRQMPDLPDPIRAELNQIVSESDDKIFVRNILVSAPYPVPDDWEHPPLCVKSSVDYKSSPPKIEIYRDDGSIIRMNAYDAWPKLVFALRKHFGVSIGDAG